MISREVEQRGRFERHVTPEGAVVYFDPEPHAYFAEIKESAKAEGGYSYVRDSRLTGVSTPCKALDGNVDPLLGWAAGLDQIGVAALADEQIAAGCELGDLEWLRSPATIAAALRDAELTWRHVRDRAAERGTSVHERIFLALAQDQRPPSLSALSASERGYGQAAMRWWRERSPEPLYAEQVTVSREHGFAGRFDLLCEIDGERVLVDAKTRPAGKARRSDHAQLAGYEIANAECGIGASERQLALLLLPDGSWREVECVGTAEDFLAALDAYRRGAELEKRMREAGKREAVAA